MSQPVSVMYSFFLVCLKKKKKKQQPFKNVKTIHSTGLYMKLAAGWIWFTGAIVGQPRF